VSQAQRASKASRSKVPRGKNAQIAVDLFLETITRCGWDTARDAWRGIATTLLTCELWTSKREGYSPFFDTIIYRESNDFVISPEGEPNETIVSSRRLGGYLAKELGVPVEDLCKTIGTYARVPVIRTQQPHNLLGHGFRSIGVVFLERYGDPEITYHEEMRAHELFPGIPLPGASPKAKIDIVAMRKGVVVALISSKWRYRHDRVEFIEEFNRYLMAARRSNPRCELYAITGEFSAARLHKALAASPPASPHGPLSATVHFQPDLVTKGLGTNGRTNELRSFEWLAGETRSWR
jgi:hypothetical protein